MPLLWVSLSFLAGIVLASIFSPPIWVWILLSAFCLLLFIFLRSSSSRFPLAFNLHPLSFLLPVFLFLGSAYYQFRQPNIDAFHIAFYNDRNYDLLITGSLAEPPDYRDSYTNLKLKVEAVDTGSGDMPASGEILVRVASNE